jgi:hypothetical protein
MLFAVTCAIGVVGIGLILWWVSDRVKAPSETPLKPQIRSVYGPGLSPNTATTTYDVQGGSPGE